MAAQEAPHTEWQLAIAQQLAQIGTPDSTTHLVVHLPDTGDAVLLDLVDSEVAGVISAEDHATKVDGGEVSVIPLSQIAPLVGTVDQAGETGEEDEQQLPPAAEIDLEPDPDTGQLLKMPRVPVVIDDSDPNVLKLAFSGGVEIDRGDKELIDFYNALRAGRTAEIEVSVFVAGTTKTQRRDKDGNVDSIVETKSVTITDVHRA
jgi:hypothetical protein